MKTIKYILLSLSCGGCWMQLAAQAVLSQRVSWHYEDVRLEDALLDISQSYKVQFSYSTYYIPINQRINAHVDDELFTIALQQLFEETDIVYKNIGDQMVLRIDGHKASSRTISYQTKPGSASQSSQKKENSIRLAEQALDKSPVDKKEVEVQAKTSEKAGYIFRPTRLDERLEEATSTYRDMARAQVPQALVPVKQMPLSPVDFTSSAPREIAVDLSRYKDFMEVIELRWKEGLAKRKPETGERFAQISFLPFVGTNLGKSNRLNNKVSVNLFWGINGGVKGVEVGGFANSVKNDVQGAQLAGFANTVGGNVHGFQASGFLNVIRGTTHGWQASGFLNVSGAGGNAVQWAGFGNHSGGDASFQAAGFSNYARGAVSAQMAGFFNKATYVKGIQLGIINVCDSIAGVPLGMINIVKSGSNRYNKVELASSKVFQGVGELKFGAKRLYNIIHFAYRWDDKSQPSWAAGFGLGTAFDMGRRSLLNLELIAMHVNEGESWTSHLSLLNQLKLTYDRRLFGDVNFFFGPTLNVFVSNAYDVDTGSFGTQLAPPKLLFKNHPSNPDLDTSVKAWIGWTGGVRF